MSEMDKITAAAQARTRASMKTDHVRYLRALLGQAMRDEADALKLARELEQAVAR